MDPGDAKLNGQLLLHMAKDHGLTEDDIRQVQVDVHNFVGWNRASAMAPLGQASAIWQLAHTVVRRHCAPDSGREPAAQFPEQDCSHPEAKPRQVGCVALVQLACVLFHRVSHRQAARRAHTSPTVNQGARGKEVGSRDPQG